MTTNKFDKGLSDTIREHNAIEIYGEAETRAALADMKARLEYDDRMAAWQKQKRVTWIPLAILAVALLSEMSNTGGGLGVQTAILASIVMAINFLFAWKFIYIMFSMSTGVPQIFWNLAAFAAIPAEQLEPVEKGLNEVISGHQKVSLIKGAAISLVGGLVSWFVSFDHRNAVLFFILGGIIWGFFYLKMMLEIVVSWGGPFFFPEATARQIDKTVEAAWRRDPANPTVSRKSWAGKIVLATRAWHAERQGKGGGTVVRAA
jgi:hypothetical protein